MYIAHGNLQRHEACEIIMRSGSFAYRYLPYWAKLPDNLGKHEITDVACDSSDRVYVLTRCPEMPVMIFDQEGNYLHSIGRGVFPGRPHGIFINSRDELYCTDDTAHVAVHMSRDGEVLRTFGTPKVPSDTGCDREAFQKWKELNHIPDSEIYDGYFQLQKQLDSIVRTAGPFNGPTRMIETDDGELYCSDGYGNAAIHHFSANGEYQNTFGAPGRKAGELRLPHGLIQDQKNRIWVADRENNRLQIFSRDGEVLGVVDNLYRPTELCTDGTYIYLSDSDAGFCVFDQEAHLVAQFGFYLSPFCFHGLGINKRGDLYAATLGKNKYSNLVKLQRITD